MIVERRSIRSSVKRSDYLLKPSEAELKTLIERIKQHDQVARNLLILHYIGLASSIACRVAHKYPRRAQDILSEAFLCLVNCIDRLERGLVQHDHTTLSKYLHISIRWKCIDFIKTDHIVRPPLNSSWIVEQIKKEGSETLYQFFTSLPYSLEDENNRYSATDSRRKHTVLMARKYNLKNPYDQFVITDILEHWIFTIREKIVIRMRLEGYTDIEIGKTLGVTSAQVGNMRKSMVERMKKALET